MRVACTRKNVPGTKALSVKAADLVKQLDAGASLRARTARHGSVVSGPPGLGAHGVSAGQLRLAKDARAGELKVAGFPAGVLIKLELN